MAVDFSTMELDPATGVAKKKKQQQLPYLNDGTQKNMLPVANAAQGNDQVITTAQNSAIGGAGVSDVQKQTQNMTQKMMTDPNFGYNPSKQKANVLSNFDANRAQAAQAARQQFGDIGGSGVVQENLLKTIMDDNMNRSNLENSLDMEAYNTTKKNWQDAIGAGQTQTGIDSNTRTNAINNLLNTRSAYEPERSQTQNQEDTLGRMEKQQGYDLEKIKAAQTGQEVLQANEFDHDMKVMGTQYGYDLEKLKTAQDFAAVSQDIDNKLKLAMQSNDAATSEKLTLLKGKIDAAAQIQAQKNAIELQNLGYDQQTQLMAQQQGYDLVKLDKTFGNEMARLVAATNLDTESKSALMELQDKLDTNQLLTTQDFEGMQRSLDRELEVAMQNKDAATQEKLTILRGELEAKAQEKQNEFSDIQRIATQSWQTGERISTEEYDKANMYYDWAQRQAAQDKDIGATKAIEDMRAFTQMSMQQQDMNQEEKMLNLKSMFEESKANNDVTRQAQIMDYAYQQDIAKMTAEQGFEMGKIGVQAQIQQALNLDEFNHAHAMQKALLVEQARQKALDRQVSNVELQLQQQGIDIASKNAEWEKLKAGVESGATSPEALTEWLKKDPAYAGITIEEPDPLESYKAIQEQFDGLKQQFGITNPSLFDDETGQLTIEGEKAFNEFYNETYYGEGDMSKSPLNDSEGDSPEKRPFRSW